MRYVLGIDAGGTKTVGLLADETGRIVGEARGTGANLQTHGELEVEKVFDGILEALGSRERIAAVCLGIAGVDRPRDEEVIRGILRRLGYRETARVVNDAAIALVNGGQHRERNMQPVCTSPCHSDKTRADVRVKAAGYKRQLAHAGIRRKRPSFATNRDGAYKRKMDGRVVRR